MRHAAVAALLLAGQAVARPAVPIEPITAILDAFRTHDVVALGEGGHGNNQIGVFLRALMNDPRFASTVNDIMYEGSNAAYQDVVDRYVNGENVSEDDVRGASENSTQTQSQIVLRPKRLFGWPVDVRALNARLPKERRLRLLLADPPIDWKLIHTTDDYTRVLALRDSFPAEVVRLEVVAKRRHVLIVFGGMHLQRKQLFSNYNMSNPIAQTLVSFLEGGPAPVKVFNVWTVVGPELPATQPDIASWRLPAFALLRGTVLGNADFKQYYSTSRQAPPMPMENQFDALLYLGPKATFGQPNLERCSDHAYLETHLARMKIVDLPQKEIDAVKRACGLP
jgi:hypothetical protein